VGPGAGGAGHRAARLLGAGLRAGSYADISGVACPSPENCTVDGAARPHGNLVAIAVSEHGGVWGRGTQITVPARLHTANLGLDALACPAAGKCVAGGSYAVTNSQGDVLYRAFLVNERDGTWGPAEPVPGSALLNRGDLVSVQAIACGAPSAARGTWRGAARCLRTASARSQRARSLC
jgi:hypothetical protein